MRLSLGEAKLARLNTLKNSARNWTLQLSERLRMRSFLNSEKSRFASLGPITVFRPRFPRKFAQVSGNWGFANVPFPINGTHWEAIAGVLRGRLKQSRLM